MPPVRITNSSRFRKTQRKEQMPLLPGDFGLIKQMERERARKAAGETSEKLVETGPFQASWTQNTDSDIIAVIHSVTERMWEPVPDKGVHYQLAADARMIRKELAPLVSMTHLYGVFPDNTTLVDRKVTAAQRSGRVRIVAVNLPDLSDLVIESATYLAMVPNEGFADLLRDHPDSTWFSREQLRSAGVDAPAASRLVKQGFLTLDPSRPGVHMISVPGQGTFLKLIMTCRRWVVDALIKGNKKWRELPESTLLEKLNNTKSYWRTMRGATLEWMIYDAIGSGSIAGFQTPIGRGWKAIR